MRALRLPGPLSEALDLAEEPLDDRLLPVADRSCTDVWKRAYSAAGLDQRDPVTGWLKRTYHGLWRFYLSSVQVGDLSRDPGDTV